MLDTSGFWFIGVTAAVDSNKLQYLIAIAVAGYTGVFRRFF